jgi:phosphoribosylamine--glycine ligase
MITAGLVGNGAREHAIGEALVRGGATLRAFMAKLNPGIAALCNGAVQLGDLNDFAAMAEFFRGVDYVVVGPEAPLVVGAADALKSAGIPVVGPTVECAQLEGSKVFTRSLLDKYNIPCNIRFKEFRSLDGVEAFVAELGLAHVVVKPDGLTGGKGVKVAGEHLHSVDDVLQYCRECLSQPGASFVIEEKLDGEEFTYLCLVDGEHVVGMPLVQDHKRAFNGDQGPNTGGMGSSSMADHLMPFITAEDVRRAHEAVEATIKAVKEETGQPYIGVLYGQFMKTAHGIKLVEYNVRFGDPEAMNVLPTLESNFAKACAKMVEGTLEGPLEFAKKATVCKYLVPEGYPDTPAVNQPITVKQAELDALGVRVYYAAVYEQDGRIFTTSSRAVAVLGIADTLSDAEQLAEQGAALVEGPLFHRTDIGTAEVLLKRINHMKQLLQSP